MDELEREAVALVVTYGIFMPKPVRAFLNKMAIRLDWKILQGVLVNG